MTPSTTNTSSNRLGVLLPGMGAVATTFMAGILAAAEGSAPLVGSLVSGEHLPDGTPLSVGLGMPALSDLVFGGWDIYEGSALDAARRSGVLEAKDLGGAAEKLAEIVPMPAAFDRRFVRNLEPQRIKEGTRREMAQALIDDIALFRDAHGLARVVGVWCGSTELTPPPSPAHASLEAFERGLDADDPSISPSMLYAYAFLRSGLPYANGAPNLALDIPAMRELAALHAVPVAGKDFKTGQTLMKTVIAPMLRARMLGVRGWYSTNILGNLDGAVLDDPDSFKTKEASKLSVLDTILDAQEQPHLYEQMDHKVRIDYYPPRGDNKEGWDNIDLFGWLGYPMQIKINFLCRDSILAAPLVLDLALLLDAAGRTARSGVQDWLSFYFKAPQERAADRPVVHDLFQQRDRLFEEIVAIQEELRRTEPAARPRPEMVRERY